MSTSLPTGAPGGWPARVHVGALNAAWVAALLLPALALAYRGGANTAYFALALCGLLGWATRRHAAQAPVFGRDLGLFALAFALPLLAVLWNQVLSLEFADRPYDAPARVACAGLLAWWLAHLAPGRLMRVQWGLGAGAVVGAVVLFASGGESRPEPPFATAITFGNLALLMGLCSWLSLGWRLTRSRLEPAFKVVAGACGLYASLISQSRGGWLALPAVVVVLLLLWRGHWRMKIVGAACCVALLGGIYAGSDMVQQRVALAGAELNEHLRGHTTESSIGLRLQFWAASLDMFAQNPLTGVGTQNVRAGFEARARAGELHPTAAEFTHSHNDMLWAMAALGVPGMLALAAVYLVPLLGFVRAARRPDARRRVAGFMGATVVVSYMVFGLTEAMFALTMNTAFYAGMTAILYALCRTSHREP